ncbi:MAG TPA: DUF1727 domain-containing protein [Desulfotomaculum sp.]|nr:DUF1727 domain-containing protein [Desulfotomaculum sp.]
MAVRLKYAGFPVEVIRVRKNAPCSERDVLAGNGSIAYLPANLYCPVF